jgi:hypothetical protein
VWFPFIAPTGAPSASPTGTIQLIRSNFPAFQSSAQDDFATADKAIDGNTNGDYAAESVMHNALDQCDPWWYVNLNDVPNGWGGPVVVKSVTVWNRSDCCLDRLYGAEVQLMIAGQIIAKRIITSAIGAGAQSLNFGAVRDVTRIRILLPGCVKTLQLAEVQAFGYVQ